MHDDVLKGKAQSKQHSCERGRGSTALNPSNHNRNRVKHRSPRARPAVLSPPTSFPSLPQVPRHRKLPWHHCCLQGLRFLPLSAAVWGWSQPVRRDAISQERLGALPWGPAPAGSPHGQSPTEATWRLDQSSWFS